MTKQELAEEVLRPSLGALDEMIQKLVTDRPLMYQGVRLDAETGELIRCPWPDAAACGEDELVICAESPALLNGLFTPAGDGKRITRLHLQPRSRGGRRQRPGKGT